MYNRDTTTRAATLADTLLLQQTLRTLGWRFSYRYGADGEEISYLVINLDTSRRRRKNDIALAFSNIEVAKALAMLIESGRNEKVIAGSLGQAPTFNAYLEILNRMGAHGCHLRCEMDFDRMTIAYYIKINDQRLMFNEWEAVEEFAQFLDRGAPNNAVVRINAHQAHEQEGIAV